MILTISTVLIWFSYLLSLYLLTFWLLTLLDKGIRDNPKELKEIRSVTIAIPSYNEEKNIRSTIQSALDLDYQHDQLEIIVINDGSIDRTEAVAKEVIQENPTRNLVFISHPHPL